MATKMDRREFIATTAAGSAGFAAAVSGLPIVAGPFWRQSGADHFVPADKKLAPEWIRALFARGEPTWYSGDDLETIGMPIGGISAGQVYLTGDGRLTCFALRIRAGGRTIDRTLDRRGFPGVRFCGEYPIGRVEYIDAFLPVEVRLEAFSPFIPLNTDESALPATVMQYTIGNTSGAPVEVTLAG